MYALEVLYPSERTPRHIERVDRGVDAVPRMNELLAAHPECERITVFAGPTRLFAVDCNGKWLPL